MFRIIRCGSGYGLVIMVSPPDAKPGQAGIKIYRFANWKFLGNEGTDRFYEINERTALGYFSGQADGLGYEAPPKEDFPTLDEALQFVKGKVREADREFLEKAKVRLKQEKRGREKNKKDKG